MCIKLIIIIIIVVYGFSFRMRGTLSGVATTGCGGLGDWHPRPYFQSAKKPQHKYSLYISNFVVDFYQKSPCDENILEVVFFPFA